MFLLRQERRKLLSGAESLGNTLNRLKFSDEEKERYWREQSKMKERANEILVEINEIMKRVGK